MSETTQYIEALSTAKRVVIKIGSALLVRPDTGALNTAWIDSLAADIADMLARGTQVLIVSSGAIALGRNRLKLGSQVLPLPEKQACAAAGQAHLTQSYEDALLPHGIITGQTLLTLPDTEDRRRWLNARETLKALMRLGAVPIINENDTVATDEIRYGDNDRLAARVAQMVSADVLVLLSDIEGLYTADPRHDPSAQHIPIIDAITPDIVKMGGEANNARGTGTGGMATKIAAARIATQAACHVAITRGDVDRPLSTLLGGARASWFVATSDPATARKQWILGSLKPNGSATIDQGAHKALLGGNSLLPAGVSSISGDFQKGDAISVYGPDGALLAHGLSRYSAEHARQIIGLNSADIITVLGYSSGDNLIHRDDLVMEE